MADGREGEEVQEGGGDETAELDDGEGGEEFAAGFVARPDEGKKPEDGGERGHHDGDDALLGAGAYGGFRAQAVFFKRAVAVQQDELGAYGEADDGDKAYKGADGENRRYVAAVQEGGYRVRRGDEYGDDAADETEWDVDERDDGSAHAAQ